MMIDEKSNKRVAIRIAGLCDRDEIESVMKRSMVVLGQGYYTPEQVQSSLKYVCVPDEQIIADGSYYVVENEKGTMIACGGWSFRNKLYAGPETDSQGEDKLNPQKDMARIRAMFVLPDASSRGLGSLILKTSEEAAKAHGFKRAALGATESGLAFYKAKGWTIIQEDIANLPDGVQLKITQMEKDL